MCNGDDKERFFITPETEEESRQAVPDHWERYEFASSITRGRRVIDVACGCGYGSAYLSQHGASEVIGLDIDKEAVEWALRNYGQQAAFRKIPDPGERWPVDDGSFDAVVSFETIEHVKDPPPLLIGGTQISNSRRAPTCKHAFEREHGAIVSLKSLPFAGIQLGGVRRFSVERFHDHEPLVAEIKGG